ncbi:MAG: hypothetical protein F2681_11830 [Actinobacteria bacterium]|uniref:Unannotated protein n=1 Tax=freshwater metagenome TaxID=449393 RepID=A0A6J6SIK9_9ZZZZ|nr:hypothetical protein [Actinomycetota bacterium]MSW78932.1 hypothetical protein [Actinomycetota bacterium]MSX55293.1 hypothetical protein [Actinomycetota bacterium]MSZ83817.1 hypothetical protein [Actinomycetota bacterium]MTB18593.1 hypothetical protein [Actinomycetota bacterium]
MSDEVDPLDALAGTPRPRRNIDNALGDMTRAAERTRSAGSALDEIIASSGARPRGEVATSETDRVEARNRWELALALALAGIGFSGVITETVAASQLLSNSGPLALAVVWPLGGLGLLLIAFIQSSYVDRFARLSVVRWIFLGCAALFAGTLMLFALDVPRKVPAAIAWLLADQLNFLLPLVVWTLAGDVFTAGQGATVFPRISRWLFGGIVAGLGVAVLAPTVLDLSDRSLPWLLAAPPVIAVLVAVLLPRALAGATTAVGHQRKQRASESLKDTVAYIRELPAYRWIFWVGVFAIFGGTMVDFGFLHLAGNRYADAGSLQAVYAGTSLACIVFCWLLQTFGTSKLLNRQGIAKVLRLLPIGALLGGAVLVVGGATKTVVLGCVALVIWRTPRFSVDGSARQAAMASLPDERRLRVSFAIDMGPLALSLIFAAGPIALAVQTDNLWIAPLIGIASAAVGLVLSRNTVRTWDDTQLSYRLKRRKRLG